ncbi:MAG: glutamate 5-kinase [Chloroflexi bacterium]|jgi:glutamate 5-kinase|nr:glutamate 5-kinase [Chloroflexota bacterium]MBT7082374.1 glutamate 5-kinase [Chloroflexota bacterium]MBT7290614.1 glutamate 5-kinase [Chloroflexota bacterium]
MHYRRVVVKLGTNLITGGTDTLNVEAMTNLVNQIANLRRKKIELVLVSSGAITAGREKLGKVKERKDIPYKQVLAAIGQNHMMNTYESLFKAHEMTIAQTLLTKTDLSDRQGYLNARNTLMALLELGVVPIVNENDVVAIDEIDELKFGDNDNLSAMVSNLVDADLLIILSDVAGLYTADPEMNPSAELLHSVDKITPEIEKMAGKTRNKRATGGMGTKIEAAKKATASGTTVIIAYGQETDVLEKAMNGKKIGTLFSTNTSKLESRKRWLLSGLSSKGRLIIDNGAVVALTQQNTSLLPPGIMEVQGNFKRGDIITIANSNGSKVACGIANYSSQDTNKIKGQNSDSIMEALGHEYGDEIIHRNNLAML